MVGDFVTLCVTEVGLTRNELLPGPEDEFQELVDERHSCEIDPKATTIKKGGW